MLVQKKAVWLAAECGRGESLDGLILQILGCSGARKCRLWHKSAVDEGEEAEACPQEEGM